MANNNTLGDIKDIVVIGLLAFGGYWLYKKGSDLLGSAGLSDKPLTEEQKEQLIGTASGNAGNLVTNTGVTIPKTFASVDQGKTIAMATDPSGNIASYKIDPNELNPFQRWYYEQGLWKIQDDQLKFSITGSGSRDTSLQITPPQDPLDFKKIFGFNLFGNPVTDNLYDAKSAGFTNTAPANIEDKRTITQQIKDNVGTASQIDTSLGGAYPVNTPIPNKLVQNTIKTNSAGVTSGTKIYSSGSVTINGVTSQSYKVISSNDMKNVSDAYAKKLGLKK